MKVSLLVPRQLCCHIRRKFDSRSCFKQPGENNVLEMLFYPSKLECSIHEGEEIPSVWVVPDAPCYYHACLENTVGVAASSLVILCRNPPPV